MTILPDDVTVMTRHNARIGHTGIPGLWIQELDAGLWIQELDAGLWTVDSGLWTLDADAGLWTLDSRYHALRVGMFLRDETIL